MGHSLNMSELSQAEGDLCVFGGSFDPVHKGHLSIVHDVLRAFPTFTVLVTPAYISPHKPQGAFFTPEQRLQLLSAVVEPIERAHLFRFEIDQEKVSYSVDTLEQISLQKRSDQALYFIIGLDNVKSFNTWKDYQKVLTLATPILIARDRRDLVRQPWMSDREEKLFASNFFKEKLRAESSTEVREALEQGNVPSELLPEEVVELLSRGGLVE